MRFPRTNPNKWRERAERAERNHKSSSFPRKMQVLSMCGLLRKAIREDRKRKA